MELSEIRKIGVIGAGNMGHGIALSFALGGYATILIDTKDSILTNSMGRINRALDALVEEKLITRYQAEQATARITTSTDLSVLTHDVDYICEAILERSADKKELYNTLDAMCPPHTILASNTSSLVLSDFGSEVKRQDKIVVTHYFFPAYTVPCVEVVKGPHTSDETFNLTYELLQKVNKMPVRVLKELPGYLVNRIQTAMMREIFDLWSKGVASAEDIDRAVSNSFGLRLGILGPLLNSDLQGMPKQGSLIVDMFNRLYHQITAAKEIPAELRERWESHQGFYKYSQERLDQIAGQMDKALLNRLKSLPDH
jgi:3-hydroxybutyryl-CoA dehydrogenase